MNTWYKAHGLQGLVIENNTGRNVAVTYDPKDAPMVAAAPAMLAALKKADNLMLMIKNDVPKSAYFAMIMLLEGEWSETWSAILEAIAIAQED